MKLSELLDEDGALEHCGHKRPVGSPWCSDCMRKVARVAVVSHRELQRALRALRPFAELWDESFRRRTGGDEARIYGFQGKNGHNYFTVGDVRRARKLVRSRQAGRK